MYQYFIIRLHLLAINQSSQEVRQLNGAQSMIANISDALTNGNQRQVGHCADCQTRLSLLARSPRESLPRRSSIWSTIQSSHQILWRLLLVDLQYVKHICFLSRIISELKQLSSSPFHSSSPVGSSLYSGHLGI